jgi:hypothetical protein
MARTPRLTAASLERSRLIATGAGDILLALQQLHPTSGDLKAAYTLVRSFLTDLHRFTPEPAALPEGE